MNLVTIYKNIFDQINTIVNNDNTKTFNNVLIYNDQIKRALDGKKFNTYFMPSVFVEMSFSNQLNMGRKLNSVDLTITFHICDMQLDDSYGNLDQNLHIFYLRDQLHKNIDGFTPLQCGALNYKGEKQDFNHSSYYNYQLVYMTNYIDTTAYNPGLTLSMINFTYSIGTYSTYQVNSVIGLTYSGL